ncbi:MAG: LptF/LptG family permease [bacterium]|nr:LptF/LptG family permease [bacterium]
MILNLYVVKEHIAPFFIGFLALTSILLMNQIFLLIWDVIGKGVPFLTVLYILLLYLPSIFALTIPMSVMVASCMAFGRLSSDFEITAIRSSGINPLKLNTFPLIMGIGLALFMIWFNNHTLPEANHKLKNIMLELAQKKPSLQIKPFVTFTDFEGYYLNVGAVNYKSGQIERVRLLEKSTEREIFAQNGKFITYGNKIILVLNNGEIHELIKDKRYRKISFKEHRIYIPMDNEEIRIQKDFRGERELSAKALKKDINRELQKSKPNKKVKNGKIYSMLVEYHKKYSIPAASFIFILLGCPLAIRVKKRGVGVGFGLPLLFFIFYYVCLVGGESLGDRGVVQPWIAMWFANAALLIIGIVATFRANKLS